MLPPVDISFIADELRGIGDEILRAAEDSGQSIEPPPQVLLSGLGQLLDTLRSSSSSPPEDSARALREDNRAGTGTLLAHGLTLMSQLAGQAQRLQLPQTAQALQGLSLPLAIWLIRRGAELSTPELPIEAAAALANRLGAPEDLAELHGLMSELVDGIDPAVIEQGDPSDPAHPWRLLLINRGLVATRSHQPALITASFDAIAEHLGGDAPDFFREAMGQMDALEDPPQVRDIVQQYFDRWCVSQRLH